MTTVSVYSDLSRLGLADETAREIADAVQRSSGAVTVDVLDARLSRLEASLTRSIMSTMIAMTGIFAVFVAAMAWIIK
jgi:hypothetical protein